MQQAPVCLVLAGWLIIAHSSSWAWGGPQPQISTLREVASEPQLMAGEVAGPPTADPSPASEEKRTSGQPPPPVAGPPNAAPSPANTSEEKRTSGQPAPPVAGPPNAAPSPANTSQEKRTSGQPAPPVAGPPNAPEGDSLADLGENIEEWGEILAANDQDGQDSELKGPVVDEEVVEKESEARPGSSLTYLVVMVVGGVVLVLATLLTTLGCLAYRCHRRTSRSYQLSDGSGNEPQLPTTTTRF